jgi:hypothetical protein
MTSSSIQSSSSNSLIQGSHLFFNINKAPITLGKDIDGHLMHFSTPSPILKKKKKKKKFDNNKKSSYPKTT